MDSRRKLQAKASAIYIIIAFVAIQGVIPSPDFPFDPAAEGLGTKGTIGVALALAVFGAAAFLLRPLLPPPASLAPLAASSALALATVCAAALWFINPYLCLLVAIGLQAWVPAASPRTSASVTPSGAGKPGRTR